jgi:hypothetical protein
MGIVHFLIFCVFEIYMSVPPLIKVWLVAPVLKQNKRDRSENCFAWKREKVKEKLGAKLSNFCLRQQIFFRFKTKNVERNNAENSLEAKQKI